MVTPIEAAVTENTLLLDSSHRPLTGHFIAGMNDVSSLVASCERSGLQVLHMPRFDVEKLRRSCAVAFIAPRLELGSAEVTSLLQFQQHGGIVIAVCGFEQVAGIAPLLQALGIVIEDKPLGSVPSAADARRDQLLPRFVDAWPVVSVDDSPLTALVRIGEDTIAAFRPWGAGGTVVIGDSRFFSERNFEGRWGYWPGNELFMAQLFERYLARDATAVEEIFRSPVKPR